MVRWGMQEWEEERAEGDVLYSKRKGSAKVVVVRTDAGEVFLFDERFLPSLNSFFGMGISCLSITTLDIIFRELCMP